jgi:hypothetical protein
LSLNERLPGAAPAAVGVNVTATVQVAAGATGFEVEQVVPEVAMAKGPVTEIAVKVRLALPVLVSVTVCDGLAVPTGSGGKVGDADKLTVGPVPVPLKLAVCGLPPALSVRVMAPVLVWIAVGLKVIEMVQFADAATELPQLLDWAKSPEATMLGTERVALPVLVKVTAWEALVVPTCWGPNVRLRGDRLTIGSGGMGASCSAFEVLPAKFVSLAYAPVTDWFPVPWTTALLSVAVCVTWLSRMSAVPSL